MKRDGESLVIESSLPTAYKLRDWWVEYGVEHNACIVLVIGGEYD